MWKRIHSGLQMNDPFALVKLKAVDVDVTLQYNTSTIIFVQYLYRFIKRFSRHMIHA